MMWFKLKSVTIKRLKSFCAIIKNTIKPLYGKLKTKVSTEIGRVKKSVKM